MDQAAPLKRSNDPRLGVYLDLPEAGVYWGRSYSPLAIQVARLQRAFSRAVDVALCIGAAAGLAAGAAYAASHWPLGVGDLSTPLLAPLWLGVLAGCTVVSRWGWRHRVRATVIERPFDDSTQAAHPSHPWVDASAGASREVLAALEVAASVAVADSGSDIQPLHLLVGLLRQSSVAATVARLGVPAAALADQVHQVVKPTQETFFIFTLVCLNVPQNFQRKKVVDRSRRFQLLKRRKGMCQLIFRRT
jgi:hypothetical protein